MFKLLLEDYSKMAKFLELINGKLIPVFIKADTSFTFSVQLEKGIMTFIPEQSFNSETMVKITGKKQIILGERNDSV